MVSADSVLGSLYCCGGWQPPEKSIYPDLLQAKSYNFLPVVSFTA
jgi:hypothetical protein